MPTARKTAQTQPYDPEKLYAVSLSRIVEFEGFTFKPGPNPIEMSGEWANLHADAIAEAHEIAAPAPQPAPVAEVHEIAER